MRSTFALLALTAGLATTVPAQSAWQSEIGIQGGYQRLAAAGSGGSYNDYFGLPGFNLGPAAPFTPAFFAVFPWKNKIGVELGVAASQLQGTLSASLVEADLRLNYALTPQIYAAAGGGLGFISNNGTTEQQLGLQAAVGYRRHLTGPLNGRVEFRTMFRGKTDNLGPSNLYSLLFGVSARTGRGAPRAARAGNSVWTRQLGLAGGYASMHPIGGGGDITAMAFPSFGSALGAFGSPEYALPTTLFAIFPVGRKIAIEPGFDLHRLQGGGSTTFSANLSARLDYAVGTRWYGALGGNLNYLKAGGQSASRTALQTALGYRFPFTSAFGGRFELNYTMWGKDADNGIAPVNTFAILFGATVPLK